MAPERVALPSVAETVREVSPQDVRQSMPDDRDLYALLTVADVAALLKVSKSWVYEHTRSRGVPRSERLPHIKLGKYVRFDPAAVREFVKRRSKLM